jgi:C1A family cysteine protease|mmetsp:Transcript_10696/g.22228  ORF Transcript_10696/g.22228 Transcript_10696/m.22228 type:complete len:368 (+) Transcript_10696:72-1175(+)
MMFTKSLSLLVVSLLASASGTSLRATDGEELSAFSFKMSLHDEWTKMHSKVYATEEETLERLKIWIANHDRIESHNSQLPKPKFTLGHNEYSDLTEDEFAQRFRLGKYSRTPELAKEKTQKLASSQAEVKTARHLPENQLPLDLPDAVNWIQLGGVTPVKNQGSCGSCWAFSTTGALEGAKYVKTGELVALSEQNLLDCDHEDLGCNGGLMDNAFKFDEKSGGLCSEDDYPYEAKQGSTCNPMNCTDVSGSEVSTFYDVPAGEEKSLLAALAMQPISVAIQADQFAFQFYKGGVLTDDSCGKNAQLDHGVLAVGYGSDLETNEPYFIVKNSWGETWGENGYIRMSRASKNEYGMCGILKMASYPVVE